MKVRELIAMLSEFDGELPVVFPDMDAGGHIEPNVAGLTCIDDEEDQEGVNLFYDWRLNPEVVSSVEEFGNFRVFRFKDPGVEGSLHIEAIRDGGYARLSESFASEATAEERAFIQSKVQQHDTFWHLRVFKGPDNAFSAERRRPDQTWEPVHSIHSYLNEDERAFLILLGLK